MRPRPTLKDIAALAEVSTASASLVLSGRGPGRVSSDTAQRIQQAAQDLGYQSRKNSRYHQADLGYDPDGSGQIRTFGFITDQVIAKPYAVDLLATGVKEITERGDGLIITTSAGDAQSEALAVAELKRRKVDYIAIICMKHRPVRLPAGLNCPTVIIDGYSPEGNVPAVVPDEVQGAYAATTHLIKLGHRRLAYLNDSESKYAAPLRLRGFRKALADAGLAQEAGLVVGTRPHPGVCDRAAAAVLDCPDRPTGIFCFNDGIAAGVYRQAQKRRLRIPRDLSVVGFDNLLLIAENTDPQLTTMQLPHAKMMRWAIEFLRSSTNMDGVSWPMVFRCDLVERDSTGPVPPYISNRKSSAG